MSALAKEIHFDEVTPQKVVIRFPQPELVKWFSDQITIAWGHGMTHTYNGLDNLEHAMELITPMMGELKAEPKQRLISKVADSLIMNNKTFIAKKYQHLSY